jgi:hypothetical protein
MNKIKTLIVSMAMFIALTSNALNITIYDGASSALTGWHGQQENQETEPNTASSQLWDMESFNLTGTQLVMTGGFNFTTPTGYGGFKPGDIFFDVNGGGYDYVATVSSAGPTYNVYTLPANTYSVYYAQNANSNPWKYRSGGSLFDTALPVLYGSFSDGEGTHYTATLDITWLLSNINLGDVVTVHNTMECGNDNLMGRFTSTYQVPESGNMLTMFGLGGVAIAAIRRRYV